jgi:hypothetical protein
MEDAAWRLIVGEKIKGYNEPSPLIYEERMAISVIAGWTYTHDGQVSTGDLTKVIGQFIDRGKDAVARILRDLEAAGFISQVENEDNAALLHWQLRDISIRSKLDRLADVLAIIDRVVAIQRADPENPQAGMELLPEGIYYNIVVRRNERRAQSNRS